MKSFLIKFCQIALGDVGIKLLNFVTFFYFARLGGAEALGWLVLGTNFLRHSTRWVNLGWNTQGLLSVAREDQKHLQIYLSKIFWAIPSIAIIAFIPWVSQSQIEVQIICVGYICVTIFDVFFPDWFFHGKQLFHWVQYSRIAAQLLYVGLVFSQIQSIDTFTYIPYLYLGAHLVVLPFAFWGARKHQFFKSSWAKPPFNKLLRESFQLGMVQILLTVPVALPPLLLGTFASFEITGQIGLALRLLLGVMVMDQFFHLFLLSGLKPQNKDLSSYLKLGIVMSGAGAVVSTCIQWVPLKDLLALIGSDFAPSEPYFKTLVYFLGLTIFHSFLQSWLFHTLTPEKFLKSTLKASLMPVLILVFIVLKDPSQMPQYMVIAEFLMISALVLLHFKNQAKALIVWFGLIGLLPLWIQSSFQPYEVGAIVLSLLWLFICYFHPMVTPFNEVSGLLKRWKKLNK